MKNALRLAVVCLAGLAAGVAVASEPGSAAAGSANGGEFGMQWVLSVLVGVALSAACGFRVFVPLLVMSIASRAGQLDLAPNFQWIASWQAMAVFGVATVFELGAYFVPFLDNALDALATPAALVAGTIVTGSMIHDVSPLLQWSLAIIAGAGAAGVVQAGTASTRLAVAPAPPTNALVATGEAVGATVTSVTAVLIPVAGAILGVAIIIGVLLLFRKFRRGGRPMPAAH